MAKTHRIDKVKYVAGRHHVGNRGLGVLAETIPATGTHGPSAYYASLDFPTDTGKEIRGLVLTRPSSGTFTLLEDGTCSLVGAADGVHTATVALYAGGVYQFDVSVYFYINASPSVSNDLDVSYTVVGRVQADLDASYAIIGRVSQDLDASYSVIGRVSQDLNAEYVVMNDSVVVIDLDAAYSVIGKVQSDLDASYAVVGRASQDLDGAFTILGAVEQDLNGTYSVIGSVAQDLDGAFTVVGSVAKDLDASYSIQGETGPCPTAEEIAEAVWSRMLTGQRIPGSAGSMLQDVSGRIAASL